MSQNPGRQWRLDDGAGLVVTRRGEDAFRGAAGITACPHEAIAGSDKIRPVKAAINTVRKNPVHALPADALPRPPGISIGSPESDNLVSKALDGTLGYSIGPGMGFRAPTLNPWANLVF